MKLSLIAALLCLTPFVSAAAAEVRLDGESFCTRIVTPVTVDAYGRIWHMAPLTILVPATKSVAATSDTTNASRTAGQKSESAPSPRSRVFHAPNSERFASASRHFANLKRPVSDQSSNGTQSADFSSDRIEDVVAAGQETSAQERFRLLDSRINTRNVY